MLEDIEVQKLKEPRKVEEDREMVKLVQEKEQVCEENERHVGLPKLPKNSTIKNLIWVLKVTKNFNFVFCKSSIFC